MFNEAGYKASLFLLDFFPAPFLSLFYINGSPKSHPPLPDAGHR